MCVCGGDSWLLKVSIGGMWVVDVKEGKMNKISGKQFMYTCSVC